LKTFNYRKIYIRRDLLKKNSLDKTFIDKLKERFESIFKSCLKDLEEDNYNSPIFKDHIEYIDNENFTTYFYTLKDQNKLPLIVRDYIAGMSDRYFSEIFIKFQKHH
ncbi:MAG: hypothetical protein KAT66_09675, partial [Candidatus Lokiarchaeota archaeon]|nr:hypothetical protein [Candidatus Lokiarchaeota archaeon]